LLQHTLRTWSWAVLFAQLDGWRPDPEVLAVACLLHDLELLPTTGLAPAHRCACFAVASGQAARRYLTAQGWSDERAGARAPSMTPFVCT
jgi:HD superfamily phosphodiesterase